MNQEFYTLATFEFAAETLIIQGKLESEGIPVFLVDENTVNSDPLISNAIGGIKLQVYTEDKERALNIYNEIRAYAKDDNGNLIVCSNCKAQKSDAFYNRKSIFHRLFPFFEKRKYRCNQCNIVTS